MVCTYKCLHENQYGTYWIHSFSLRASCYRIPNLAAAQTLSCDSRRRQSLIRPRSSRRMWTTFVTWQANGSSIRILWKMQKDSSLMSLGIVNKRNNSVKLVLLQGSSSDPQSYDCWTFPLGHCEFLRWRLVFALSIYNVLTKTWYCTFCRGEKTASVYRTTHEHLAKYLDVVWSIAIAKLLRKICLSAGPLLHSISMISAAKFRLNWILQQPARFRRNLLNLIWSTILYCGGFN